MCTDRPLITSVTLNQDMDYRVGRPRSTHAVLPKLLSGDIRVPSHHWDSAANDESNIVRGAVSLLLTPTRIRDRISILSLIAYPSWLVVID